MGIGRKAIAVVAYIANSIVTGVFMTIFFLVFYLQGQIPIGLMMFFDIAFYELMLGILAISFLANGIAWALVPHMGDKK